MVTKTPKAHLRAILFLNGKKIAWGKVKIIKIWRHPSLLDTLLLPSTTIIKKKLSRWTSHFKLENKVVPTFSNPNDGERCHVHILDLYYNKLPKEVQENDYFYAHPVPAMPRDPKKRIFWKFPLEKYSFYPIERCVMRLALKEKLIILCVQLGLRKFLKWCTRKNKTLGRARDPRANGTWLNKLTEWNMKCLS